MTAAELAEAKHALAKLAFPDDRLKIRRLKAAARGRFDPRRTMRASLRVGGDIIMPAFRARAEVQPTIVALCDISGSMSQYSRLLLHFLHAARSGGGSTLPLRHAAHQRNAPAPPQGPGRSARRRSDAVRTGRAARASPRRSAVQPRWSRRVLGQGATVLLITDGLERDERRPGLCRRDGPAAPLLPAADLAEPAAPLRRLRARRRGGSGRCCRMSTSSAQSIRWRRWATLSPRCRTARGAGPTRCAS